MSNLCRNKATSGPPRIAKRSKNALTGSRIDLTKQMFFETASHWSKLLHKSGLEHGVPSLIAMPSTVLAIGKYIVVRNTYKAMMKKNDARKKGHRRDLHVGSTSLGHIIAGEPRIKRKPMRASSCLLTPCFPARLNITALIKGQHARTAPSSRLSGKGDLPVLPPSSDKNGRQEGPEN